MKKSKIIDVVLIDDNEAVFKSLEYRAMEKGIRLHHADNGKDGFKLYDSSSKYKGLILDGECYIEKKDDQDSGESSEVTKKFLSWANMKLQEYKNSGKYIPAVALTAHGKVFIDTIPDDTIEIFQKNIDEDKMFDQLRLLINNSEEQKLKNKYKGPFQVFEKEYLSKKSETTLIGMLKKYDSPNLEDINNFTSSIRPFIEEIFIKLNEVDKNLAPDSYYSNFEPQVHGLITHLEGHPKKIESFNSKGKKITKFEPQEEVYAPQIITILMRNMYVLGSTDGAHFSEYQADRYFFKSQLNALLEILVWFGRWMDENKGNND